MTTTRKPIRGQVPVQLSCGHRKQAWADYAVIGTTVFCRKCDQQQRVTAVSA